MYYTHETRQCPPYSHACNELMLRLAGMQNQCNLLRIIGAQNVRHAPLLWASVCVRCAHGVGPQHSATGRPRPPFTRAPFPGSCSRRVPSVCACLCPRTSTRSWLAWHGILFEASKDREGERETMGCIRETRVCSKKTAKRDANERRIGAA